MCPEHERQHIPKYVCFTCYRNSEVTARLKIIGSVYSIIFIFTDHTTELAPHYLFQSPRELLWKVLIFLFSWKNIVNIVAFCWTFMYVLNVGVNYICASSCYYRNLPYEREQVLKRI